MKIVTAIFRRSAVNCRLTKKFIQNLIIALKVQLYVLKCETKVTLIKPQSKLIKYS